MDRDGTKMTQGPKLLGNPRCGYDCDLLHRLQSASLGRP